MLLIQIRRVAQSFIKIESNSMLRIPLASPVFPRQSTKTKASNTPIDTTIERIRSHCMYAEGRERKAYYKILEKLEKERRDTTMETSDKEKRGE